jgi:ParB-like chromosome segregation protein Spo0J
MEPPAPLRMSMDEQALGDLADSLKRYGLLHPIIVVPAHVVAENGEHYICTCGHHTKAHRALLGPCASLDCNCQKFTGADVVRTQYEIVDGHRRYIAAGIAGLEDLECKVYDSLEDAKYGVMLDANMMREDVTPAEEGVQFLEMAEKRGWTMPQLTRYFGRSETYINERVKLVKDFPDIFSAVAARSITWTQAKSLMRCPDKNWRAYMLDQAITHGASSRTIVNLVDQWKTLELARQGQAAPHTSEPAMIYAAAETVKCIWCGRDDDPQNFVHMPVHSYHVRDMREFLSRTGINPLPPGRDNAQG